MKNHADALIFHTTNVFVCYFVPERHKIAKRT